MIVLQHRQGTQEWLDSRLGIPTASQFHRILSPTGKLSAQADDYMAALLAERMIGQNCSGGPRIEDQGPWMTRGSALEAEARSWYAFTKDVEPARCGLCLTDDRIAGCSPDALVGDDGLLEIKCPSAAKHAAYLMEGGLAEKYRPQVQGQLWVTGRAWVDVLSYCPGFEPPLDAALIRVDRDEPYIAALNTAVRAFVKRLDSEHARLTSGDDLAGVLEASIDDARTGAAS